MNESDLKVAIIEKLNLNSGLLDCISKSKVDSFLNQTIYESFMKSYLTIFVSTYLKRNFKFDNERESYQIWGERFIYDLCEDYLHELHSYSKIKDVDQLHQRILNSDAYLEFLEDESQHSSLNWGNEDDVNHFGYDPFFSIQVRLFSSTCYELIKLSILGNILNSTSFFDYSRQSVKNKYLPYLQYRIKQWLNRNHNSELMLGKTTELYDPMINYSDIATGGIINVRPLNVVMAMFIKQLVFFFYKGGGDKVHKLNSEPWYSFDYSNLFDFLRSSGLNDVLTQFKMSLSDYDICVDFFGKYLLSCSKVINGESCFVQTLYKGSKITNEYQSKDSFKRNFILFIVMTYLHKGSGSNYSCIGIDLPERERVCGEMIDTTTELHIRDNYSFREKLTLFF